MISFFIVFILRLTLSTAQSSTYTDYTPDQCSDLVGGSSITSIAECEQAAAALGWSDVVVDSQHSFSDPWYPPGCFLNSYGSLRYNTLTTSTTSCRPDKCACSIPCPSGTYQDENGLTTCKSCTAGFYQELTGRVECNQAWSTCTAGHKQTLAPSATKDRECSDCPPGTYQDENDQTTCESCTGDKSSVEGASSCDFTAITCPAGTYASGSAACTQCGDGKSSVKGGECYLLAKSENLDQIKVWYNKYNQCS